MITVEVDGWTLVPLRDAVAMTHLIAARDDDELRTTDIDVVLYTRSPAGWEAEAYGPGVSKEDALLDLAAEFGLPDPIGGNWMIDDLDPANVTGTAGERAAFKTGFFMDDPLSHAAEAMDDPEPLVEAAETMGMPAAGSAVNAGSIEPQPTGCGCDVVACIHDSIAAGIDAMIADSTLTLEEIEQIAFDTMPQQFFFCCPRVWTHWQGTWSQWQCGSWSYAGRESGSIGYDECVYTRPVERTQDRIQVRRCFNCTTISRRQTRIQTGTQETKEIVDSYDPCPDASNVSGAAGCAPSPDYPINTTGWTPQLPPC